MPSSLKGNNRIRRAFPTSFTASSAQPFPFLGSRLRVAQRKKLISNSADLKARITATGMFLLYLSICYLAKLPKVFATIFIIVFVEVVKERRRSKGIYLKEFYFSKMM
jgi:hypothetical protein